MEALRREWGHWPAQRFGDLFFIVYWLDHIHVSSKKKLLHESKSFTPLHPLTAHKYPCYTFFKGHAKILISLVNKLNMVNIF
jgi:hypothetical protein